MTEKIEEKEELKQILCIWYPVIFRDQTEALLDSRSKVYVISQAFTSQLRLKIWKINVEAQKIVGTTLET